MIVIIRISGDVKIREEVRETFRRLGLTRKYSCIVLDKPTPVEMGMIKEIKDFVAFGELDAETYKKLIEARGKKFKEKTKVFRLHPPRKGIDSKLHFGVKKGVLGNHGKEINKLVERML
ncbi:50S ribosomal protein L30 [uncultured archaeon]|nr:50S ribosomal protein L30 [uncultured archaeon]